MHCAAPKDGSANNLTVRSTAADIRSAVAERRTVLFCGAGVSMDPPATLPDWKTFRDRTIEAVATAESSLSRYLAELVNPELVGEAGHALAPELVATQVRTVVPDYFQSLGVLDHDQTNQNHQLIAQLIGAGLVTHVVTTNFDQLIEKALAAVGIHFHVYRSDADFAAFPREGPGCSSVEVFKLHGCISDPDTIVATVEQEAVGLSPQKAGVLRWLWKEFTTVFWGYSGADLKLDLDYLQMVSSASNARGFFWNLYSTPSWREEPNEFVKRLVELYRGRGIICHEALCDVLGPLVDHKPRPGPKDENASQLREQRNEELAESLRDWAQRSVQPQHALEIFARLHECVNDLSTAAVCYQRLGDLGFAEGRPAVVALAYTRGSELLARMGSLEKVDDALRLADDRARTAGALDLDLMVARTRAAVEAMRGNVLLSVQPRGFARLLSRWATPGIAADALGVELDTADHLLAQGLLDPAFDLFEAAEREARQAGRLVTVADALARRSRVHELRNESSLASACIREAREILRVLGLSADARLLDFRSQMTEKHAAEPWDATSQTDGIFSAADQAKNRRLSCEIVLEIVESQDIEPQLAIDLLSRVGACVNEGGHHLKVRLAIQRSRVHRKLKNIDAERTTISDVLPLLDRVGNERAAVELYGRLASLGESTGESKEKILRNLAIAAGICRRTIGVSGEMESWLARLRRELGQAPDFSDYESFVADWSKCVQELPDVLGLLAERARVNEEKDLGRALENRFGSSGRFIWMLWNTAVLCRQLREENQQLSALKIARGCLPIARVLADSQLTAIFHNECGLDLMKLQRPDLALKEFKEAIRAADAAADRVELVDDLLNAAGACEAARRFDLATEFYSRAQQEVIIRQDLVAAVDVSLWYGEALKVLGNDEIARSHFETAEYLSRALGDWSKIERSILRLGKIYWNLGEYEQSIHYRQELVEVYALQGNAGSATPFALLVANTYDEKLDRPRDAAPYYRRALALNDEAQVLDREDLNQRWERCQVRMGNTAAAKGFWDLLIDAAGSENAAEYTAARLALAIDFNLWRFDPRSFAAWYERVFPGTVSYPAPGDTGLPLWPFAATYQLIDLGRSARQLHRHNEALSCFSIADRVALAFSVAQPSFLAHREISTTHRQLGADELATSHGGRAAEIKQNFVAQAVARGLQPRAFGERTLTPWALMGVILTFRTREIPDVSGRHTMIKGRLADEFFMGE